MGSTTTATEVAQAAEKVLLARRLSVVIAAMEMAAACVLNVMADGGNEQDCSDS